MYNQLIRFSLLSLLLLLNACSTPSTLKHDNTNLNLQVDQKRIQILSTPIKENKENFGILFLKQKLLRHNDGNLIMLESVKTDMQYMFEPTTSRIISVVFDTVNIVPIYQKGSIHAYQLVLQDHRVLNIIVTHGYVDELQMLYGMNTKQFIKTLKRLNAHINSVPYKNAIELKNEQTPLISRWTTWKINFYPLVVPLPQLGRF